MNTPVSATAPVLQAHQVILFALATLAELRESDTESHLLRVQGYVRVLCERLKTRSTALAATLTDDYVDMLVLCVPIYDMGTVGVPDRILLKPGKLTPDELAIMRQHTTLGYEAMVRAETTLKLHSPLLAMAKDVALCHHERWNGAGYPKGLLGPVIPLAARILAVADVYDALISSKVYKDGVPHDKALQIIASERGAHFDPDVVDAFVEAQEQFAAIASRHADTDADMQQKIEYMANAIAEVAVL